MDNQPCNCHGCLPLKMYEDVVLIFFFFSIFLDSFDSNSTSLRRRKKAMNFRLQSHLYISPRKTNAQRLMTGKKKKKKGWQKTM